MFKEVGVFEAAPIVLPKGGEVRYWITESQPQEPPVSQVDVHFFDGLAHAFDAKHVLEDDKFHKKDRIHARASVVWGVFIFYEVVDKGEVDMFVDFSHQVRFRNHLI